MVEKHTMLKVDEVSFDPENPRIKKALEKYGDQLNAERIHFALRSATDGARGTSSYSSHSRMRSIAILVFPSPCSWNIAAYGNDLIVLTASS